MKRHTKILTTALAAVFAFASIPALSALCAQDTVAVSAAAYTSTTPTGYTKASDVDYVTQSGYTVNWGARGEDCTFLSLKALAFYTSGNTYDAFIKNSGGTSQSNASSSALYSVLQKFMKSKHSKETSYNATRDLYKYTDCVLNGYNVGISSFYSGDKIGPAWDSGSTWNREHTWPNSKGLGGNDENDIMMLRPTSTSENGARGNTAYGQSGSYYDPNDESGGTLNLHGDCARIVLYVYTRWGNTSYMWGSSGVMENLNVLLAWMKEDPVDTWEMGRNDAVQSITGTRNVFVDYPELAWKLFGQPIPSKMSTPSGIANGGVVIPPDDSDSSGSSTDSSSDSSDIILPPISSDSSTGSSTVDPTPDDPTPDTPLPNGTLATFDFGAKGSAVHKDGTEASSKTYTEGSYSLALKNGTKFYPDSFDAKGNSCLKLGSGSSNGSFSFTVPDDVTSVAVYAAQYKSNPGTLTINGKQHTLTTASDKGEYEAYIVDTTTTKTVTVESNKRAMIDKILFLGADDTSPDDSTQDSDTSSGGSTDSSVDPTPDDSTSNDSTSDTPSTDSSSPDTSSGGSTDSSGDPTPDDSTSDTPSTDSSATDSETPSDSDLDETDGATDSETDKGIASDLLGCSSFIGASTLGMVLLAGCAMLLKKKED